MKIIFDSEEQKITFARMQCCPGIFGYDELRGDECSAGSCVKCWENSGIEMEVSDD